MDAIHTQSPNNQALFVGFILVYVCEFPATDAWEFLHDFNPTLESNTATFWKMRIDLFGHRF